MRFQAWFGSVKLCLTKRELSVGVSELLGDTLQKIMTTAPRYIEQQVRGL